MIIIPALDFIDGKCVRLYQGDFNQKKTYETPALPTLKKYVQDGARRLHLVDLQGAKDPKTRQLEFIKNLVQNVDCPVQLGGGLRSFSDAKDLYDAGVDQVILGSLAISNSAETRKILKEYPRTILSADLMIDNGQMFLASGAWSENTQLTMDSFLSRYPEVQYVLSTDISRDGTMTEPNFQLYQNLGERFPNIQFIASGGVSDLNDLTTLKELNVYAVVVGKALLEGAFTLKEALSC